MARKYVLVINPGSTSTKVAIYEGKNEIKSNKIVHNSKELEKYKKVSEQYDYRLKLIYDWLKKEEVLTSSLIAVVGRGGLLKPIPGGTYIVTEKMIEDLENSIQWEHASNLGGILAKGIGDKEGIKSYILDPVAVDEFEDIARISGLKDIERKSLIHALNIKAVSYRRANELNENIEELNFIVAHLGGGISIAPVKGGKMIDVNNAIEMGPFSPDRTGGLPVGDVVRLCYSGKYTYDEMLLKIKGKGGLAGYLGTMDGREIEKMIEKGDKKAELIYKAMAYQIGKEIGAMSTVLCGDIDSIILTGGLAYSEYLVDIIEEMIGFISNVIVYPGEDEMKALNDGVLRVLNGEEKEKIYEDEVILRC
ncbi:butyrate kinase [Anaerosalibacter massiliensis]|mgnify:CR=1 FL=1|uniref:Probable butyrate kinase n=1 Tax=Anaerosalibacter massiliensis TaxID=1347392 RepID=A0A9X2MHN4_9FIRM|nr:butyrate kinase [Anaerosalibacter massiliensis]MCR2043332.1 butyrate kinase [Anaerosalibacter massiliensis]